MGEDEMRRIGGWMADVLDAPDDLRRLHAIRDQVRELCASFPLYRGLRNARRDPVPIAP
jgi:glycine hydroxymethyltransferase